MRFQANTFMVKLGFRVLMFSLIGTIRLLAQVDTNTIVLINPSFEGTPSPAKLAAGWVDCGWRNETPPDIQPAPNGESPYFGVTKKAFDGQTYLGMVTRENDSYERVAQRLSQPMHKGRCYSFSIYLCRSLEYLSASNIDAGKELKPFTTPIILRVFSGDAYCHQKELLAETSIIDNTDWKKYTVTLSPTSDAEYIELEAFYKTPVLKPYNGNILLDKASDITRILCPNEKPFAVAEKNNKKKTKPEPAKEQLNLPEESKNKILKALDKDKIKVGQTIKIEKLFFKSDSANFDSSSYVVLEEVYLFLKNNPLVKIEIGGHTNSIPPHEYCDKLSSKRAQTVKEYILNKGITIDRVISRGYGKRMPVASNVTKLGRSMNQRVEIKIISLG
ncbi:MAG: OmpA family protein [Saprospiraceae bacterium]